MESVLSASFASLGFVCTVGSGIVERSAPI
jgi:hypothetical protein